MRNTSFTARVRPDAVRFATETLRALTHPLRIKLLSYIATHQPVSVHKIYESLHLEQSIVSQHLRFLRMYGLVEGVRDGKFIHYKINEFRIQKISEEVKLLVDQVEGK